MTQVQLLALVRALLCKPDVLVVHDIRAQDEESKANLRRVLANYADGAPITRLDRVPRTPKRLHAAVMEGAMTWRAASSPRPRRHVIAVGS